MNPIVAQIDWSKPEWWAAIGGVASAIAALLSVFTAIVYTVITRWLFIETRRQRKALTEPCVIVYSRPDESAKHIIMLVVENIGRSTAFDIRFESDREIPSRAFGIEGLRAEPKTMDSGAFVSGIPALSPGGKREFSWGQFGGLQQALGGKPLKIKCRFRHENQELWVDSVVDVASLEGTDASDRDPVSDCAKQLATIADQLKRVVSGSGVLRVQQVDLEAERDAALKQHEEIKQARLASNKDGAN